MQRDFFQPDDPSHSSKPRESHEPRLSPTGDIQAIVNMGIGLQAEASVHNIHNVFDDGGYKELILLRLFNLRKLHREGDDAVDSEGRLYEIKTVARVSSRGARKRSLFVTTEHTLTVMNIRRYRNAFLWIVAVFDQSSPEAIFEIEPARLEPYFSTWERRIREQTAASTGAHAPPHLNNPKIPLTFIQQNGIRVWPSDQLHPRITEALEKAQDLDEQENR